VEQDQVVAEEKREAMVGRMTVWGIWEELGSARFMKRRKEMD